MRLTALAGRVPRVHSCSCAQPSAVDADQAAYNSCACIAVMLEQAHQICALTMSNSRPAAAKVPSREMSMSLKCASAFDTQEPKACTCIPTWWCT